jgi:hypothetical protein
MPKKITFKDFLSEFIEGLLLVLWIIASGVTNLSVTFTLLGALFIFGASVAYFISKRYFDTKKEIAKISQEEKITSAKIFWEANKPKLNSESASIEQMARSRTYFSLIALFEQSVKDETLSEQERNFYTKIVKLLKDIEKVNRYN